MRNIAGHLVPISLLIIIFSKPVISDNIRDQDGVMGVVCGLFSVAMPAIEYFSNENGEDKWGVQFLIDPTFVRKDWKKLRGIYHQIRLSYTFLFDEYDISRFYYAPFLSIFDTIGLGIPLGGYYHAGDFGYSTGLIMEVYPLNELLFKFFASYEYRYNPETKNSSYSIYAGFRFPSILLRM